jgi:hypothetical protein
MKTASTSLQTALDELVRRNPAIDTELLDQARRAAELLRQLGLLSTEPTEAIRPFTRRRQERSEPTCVSNWAATHGIQFTKAG